MQHPTKGCPQPVTFCSCAVCMHSPLAQPFTPFNGVAAPHLGATLNTCIRRVAARPKNAQYTANRSHMRRQYRPPGCGGGAAQEGVGGGWGGTRGVKVRAGVGFSKACYRGAEAQHRHNYVQVVEPVGCGWGCVERGREGLHPHADSKPLHTHTHTAAAAAAATHSAPSPAWRPATG